MALSHTMKKVKSMLKTNIEHPKLIFRGKVLMDDKILSDYDIKNEYILLLKNDTPLNDPNKVIQSTIQTKSPSPSNHGQYERKTNANDENMLSMMFCTLHCGILLN